MYKKIKNGLSLLWGLVVWLLPMGIFLIATFLPRILWKPSFHDYLEFLKILVWPFTVLVVLYFFRTVVTYLFFSMNEFNFFGAKGNLKNVNEVILEEVNKRFLEKENDEKRKMDMEKNEEIRKKLEIELNQARGTAGENLDLAKEIFKQWKKSTDQSKKIVSDLEVENKRLKELFSGLTSITSEVSSISNVDESKTSDPVSEETSIK